ncbi:MAG: sigma factor [Anaerolineales bacterium]
MYQLKTQTSIDIVLNPCSQVFSSPINKGKICRAQETFIRAYERLETCDVERPFGPWIRRVPTNVCLSHMRGQKPESRGDQRQN